MDEVLKRIVQADAEKEAEAIMAEVTNEPTLEKIQVPEEVRYKLISGIREYEAKRAYENLSEEDKELIYLGRLYKKRCKWKRYIAVALVAILGMTIGMIAVGENENIFKKISHMLDSRQRMSISSEDTETLTFVDEDAVYQEIETQYDFIPVKLRYRPTEVLFLEATLDNAIQGVNMIFGTEDKVDIIYTIHPSFRDSSWGIDIEDKKIQEYQMVIEEIKVSIVQYQIEESKENRWMIQFAYQDIQYLMIVNSFDQKEIFSIVEGLHFPKQVDD